MHINVIQVKLNVRINVSATLDMKSRRVYRHSRVVLNVHDAISDSAT